MASFFTYSTSAFGTLCLVALMVSFLTGERIDAGVFGLIGFPLLSFLYALSRKIGGNAAASEAAALEAKLRDIHGHPRYEEFLSEEPERKLIYKEDLPERFSLWLSRMEHGPKTQPQHTCHPGIE